MGFWIDFIEVAVEIEMGVFVWGWRIGKRRIHGFIVFFGFHLWGFWRNFQWGEFCLLNLMFIDAFASSDRDFRLFFSV